MTYRSYLLQELRERHSACGMNQVRSHNKTMHQGKLSSQALQKSITANMTFSTTDKSKHPDVKHAVSYIFVALECMSNTY